MLILICQGLGAQTNLEAAVYQSFVKVKNKALPAFVFWENGGQEWSCFPVLRGMSQTSPRDAQKMNVQGQWEYRCQHSLSSAPPLPARR